MSHNARLAQTVKIKMMQGEMLRVVLIAQGKTGAPHKIVTAATSHQALGKSCLSGSQVAGQDNSFTATQLMADLSAQL